MVLASRGWSVVRWSDRKVRPSSEHCTSTSFGTAIGIGLQEQPRRGPRLREIELQKLRLLRVGPMPAWWPLETHRVSSSPSSAMPGRSPDIGNWLPTRTPVWLDRGPVPRVRRCRDRIPGRLAAWATRPRYAPALSRPFARRRASSPRAQASPTVPPQFQPVHRFTPSTMLQRPLCARRACRVARLVAHEFRAALLVRPPRHRRSTPRRSPASSSLRRLRVMPSLLGRCSHHQ